jgi:hypothetical protein
MRIYILEISLSASYWLPGKEKIKKAEPLGSAF